jgi:predicted nucleic acid-binding protein
VIAIVDTSALYSAMDTRDAHHDSCAAVFERHDLQFIIPALCVTEMSYFLGERHGAAAEAAFVRTLEGMEVEAPSPDEWPKIADLVERFADFPLGAVNASVAILAERYETDLIVTLDRRYFAALRSARGPFHLLP